MKRLFLIPVLTTVILCSSSVFALAGITCPDVNVIKQVGLNHIEIPQQDHTGWIASYVPYNKYQTNNAWKFFIGTDHSDILTPEEAMAKANVALQSLAFKEEQSGGHYYICTYQTDDASISAFTISPPTTVLYK